MMNNGNWVEVNVLKDWIDFKNSVLLCPFAVESWDMLKQFYENLPIIGRNYIDDIFNGQTFYMDPNEVLDYINYLAETNLYPPNYAQHTQPTPLTQPRTEYEIDKTFEKIFKHLNDVELALQEVEQVPIDHSPDDNFSYVDNFQNSPIQDYNNEDGINSSNAHNYNYFEENFEFNNNTLDESPPLNVRKMHQHINKLGDEVLHFSWDDTFSESSDDFMDDLECYKEVPLDHNCLFSPLPEEDPYTPPLPPETINVPPRHIPHNPTMQPTIETELSREHIYLNQAELDRLWLENANLELDELERLIFNPETHDSDNIVELDQTINDLPVLSNLIFSPRSDVCNTEYNLNMLNNNFSGELKIIDNTFHGNVDNFLEDLFKDDAINFILPIYHPKVDPLLNYHANQFSLYPNKLIYPKTKKKKYWLGKFPFWRKFGSVEFMPVHTVVYAARECHPSLIELVKL